MLKFEINDLGNEIASVCPTKQSIRKHSKMFGLMQRLSTNTSGVYAELTNDENDFIIYLHEHLDEIDDECRALFDDIPSMLDAYDKYMLQCVIEKVERLRDKIVSIKDIQELYKLTTKVLNTRDEFFSQNEKAFIGEVLSKITDRRHRLYAFYKPSHQYFMTVIAAVSPHVNLNWIDTSELTDMSHVFYGILFDGDISLWDTSNVVTFRNMFDYSNFNGDISMWNVHKSRCMDSMFANNRTFNRDISIWKLSPKCETVDMFYNCPITNNHRPKCMQDGKNA